MLRSTAVLAGLAGIASAVPATPSAAQSSVPAIARGEFSVRLTGSGATDRRPWRLAPSCLGASCSTIKLRMRRADGDYDNATLQRDGDVYRGRVTTRALCRGRLSRRSGTLSIAIRVTGTTTRELTSGRETIITGLGGELRIRSASCPAGRGLGRVVRVSARRVDLPGRLRPNFKVSRPSPSISAGTTVVRFTDQSPTNNDIRTWHWSFGDPASGSNNRATGPSVVHEFMTVGTYRIELRVTDSYLQVATVSKSLVVSP